jgi:hypothetical protein
MPDVMVVLACFSQCVEPTTRRQLGRVIEALLSVSGRMTMKGLSRWSDKGGNRDKEVPRGFPLPHHQAYGFVPWRFDGVQCINEH